MSMQNRTTNGDDSEDDGGEDGGPLRLTDQERAFCFLMAAGRLPEPYEALRDPFGAFRRTIAPLDNDNPDLGLRVGALLERDDIQTEIEAVEAWLPQVDIPSGLPEGFASALQRASVSEALRAGIADSASDLTRMRWQDQARIVFLSDVMAALHGVDGYPSSPPRRSTLGAVLMALSRYLGILGMPDPMVHWIAIASMELRDLDLNIVSNLYAPIVGPGARGDPSMMWAQRGWVCGAMYGLTVGKLVFRTKKAAARHLADKFPWLNNLNTNPSAHSLFDALNNWFKTVHEPKANMEAKGAFDGLSVAMDRAHLRGISRAEMLEYAEYQVQRIEFEVHFYSIVRNWD